MENKYVELEKILKLKKQGTITASEYEAEKKKILEKSNDQINQNDNKESFSVNFPTSSESDTSIETIGENDNIVDGKSNLKSGVNLAPIFILLAMLIVAFEWILYKKGN